MDDLDVILNKAAPPALGDDPGAAQQARFLAQAIAADGRAGRAGSRLRKALAGLSLGIGIVGLGVTAASAGPSLLAWVGWESEAKVERSFSFVDGEAVCHVVARVQPEYRDVADGEADRRTAEARVFLVEFQWDRAVQSITTAEIEAAFAVEREHRRPLIEDAEANGTTPPPAATRGLVAADLMGEAVQTAFERAGYLRAGTSLEMAAECAAVTDEGTE